MEIQYGTYDANSASILEAGGGVLEFPTNMNPTKIYRIACFRNADNKVVVSLMDENSTLYTRDEWETLSKTPVLQREHERKMDELVGNAQDAVKAFLKQE